MKYIQCFRFLRAQVTVLRNNFFMNHLLKTDCDNIDKEGWFSNPLGATRNSFVCTNDIAEAAAVCPTPATYGIYVRRHN